MEECWYLAAKKVAKRHSVHSSAVWGAQGMELTKLSAEWNKLSLGRWVRSMLRRGKALGQEGVALLFYDGEVKCARRSEGTTVGRGRASRTPGICCEEKKLWQGVENNRLRSNRIRQGTLEVPVFKMWTAGMEPRSQQTNNPSCTHCSQMCLQHQKIF